MGKHKHCKHYYKLLSIIKEKDEEIADLKKRLQYYENYNSPPSASSLLWKKQKRERRADGNNKDERKLGRKNGHQGVSHSFRPSENVKHSMDRCSRCGLSSISLKHQEYRLIVDVPVPEPYTVKEHIINVYHCKGCNTEVRPEVDIPKPLQAWHAWQEHSSNYSNIMVRGKASNRKDSIHAQSYLWIEDICRNDK